MLKLARFATDREEIESSLFEVAGGVSFAKNLDRLEVRQDDTAERVRKVGTRVSLTVVAADVANLPFDASPRTQVISGDSRMRRGDSGLSERMGGCAFG